MSKEDEILKGIKEIKKMLRTALAVKESNEKTRAVTLNIDLTGESKALDEK